MHTVHTATTLALLFCLYISSISNLSFYSSLFFLSAPPALWLGFYVCAYLQPLNILLWSGSDWLDTVSPDIGTSPSCHVRSVWLNRKSAVLHWAISQIAAEVFNVKPTVRLQTFYIYSISWVAIKVCWPCICSCGFWQKYPRITYFIAHYVLSEIWGEILSFAYSNLLLHIYSIM